MINYDTREDLGLPARETNDRRDMVLAAVADEHTRFTKAIRQGAIVMLHTHCGTYRVTYVTGDWRYVTPQANGGFGFTWCGCNDATWDDLMRQAGVARHPLFTQGDDK